MKLLKSKCMRGDPAASDLQVTLQKAPLTKETRIHREEIDEVSSVVEKEAISPENTRIRKVNRSGRIAFNASKPQWIMFNHLVSSFV